MSFCLTMFIEGSTGTEVNKALTSYEEMTSPCSNVTCLIFCMKCWVFLFQDHLPGITLLT